MEINLTTSYVGILSLITFIIAYAIVMAEEFTHLRKSKPVVISAAVIWGIIAFYSMCIFFFLVYFFHSSLLLQLNVRLLFFPYL